MSNSLSASKKVMQNYLSELLTDESASTAQKSPLRKGIAIENPHKEQKLSDLLQSVSLAETKLESPLVSNKSLANTEVIQTPPVIETKREPVQTNATQASSVRNSYRENNFQAMFFDVAGLTVAVPLIQLGGIHNVDKVTGLMGKPDWFSGVMIHREEKINVVDTARWVMPEKCDDVLIDSLNYQYVIMLNNSDWGLMAEKLVDTVTLEPEDVKWAEDNNKRPWLAGLVKNRMCALLDVESLITLLNDGSGIHPS